MKKIYLMLVSIFAITVCDAQIINIPDAAFKAKLLAATQFTNTAVNAMGDQIKIDANNDGQLQLSEAQQVVQLYVPNSSIHDLTGILSFTNLTSLTCNGNPIVSLNLSNLVSLRNVNCFNCTLTNLNLSGLVNLMSVKCENNSLASLNLDNLSGLYYAQCNNNQLTGLSLNGLANLHELYCQNNHLTAFSFTGLNTLSILNCSGNNLTAIDTSTRPNVHTRIDCSNNQNLVSISTKDNYIGIDDTLAPADFNFQGTPNLQRICADAGELSYYQNKINQAGYTNPNCLLSATCNFTTLTSHTTAATACGSYTWAYNNQTYTASGTYTAVTGNQVENLNLTINNSLITTQPIAPKLCTVIGSSASMTVAANCTSPTYVWQYRVITSAQPNPDWIAITSANAGTVYTGFATAILTIARTSTALPKVGTQYRAVVSGGICGAITSNAVDLTILGTVKAGAITSPTAVCTGNNITFILDGYVGTNIQWQSALSASGAFANIPNATSYYYTAANMQAGSNKSYRAIVTNGPCGTTATTAIKTIKVTPPAEAGTVTGGGIVCSGSSGTLKVAGNVGKIQWQYSANGSFYLDAPTASTATTALPFGTTSVTSTTATYLVTNLTATLYFRVKVTNGVCQPIYGMPVQFTVATSAIAGTASPSSSTICSSGATVLALSQSFGTVTWQKSINATTASPTWSNIANSNASSLTAGNLTYTTAYRAKVTIGDCSTVYSNTVYVNIIPQPVAKSISAEATTPNGLTQDAALCTSVAKVLKVSNYVGAVQWQKSTTSATTGFANIAGAQVSSYTVTNPTVGANYFRVKFSNACGAEVYSNVYTVYYKDCAVSKAAGVIPFDIKGYPNPYTRDFSLDITTSSDAPVQIGIYDMTGRLIEDRTVMATDVSALRIGADYPAGIYNVIVLQEGKTKTIRMVKE